jgi:hypothetical protein
MQKEGNMSALVIAVAIMATPASVAAGYYYLANNQTFAPLGHAGAQEIDVNPDLPEHGPVIRVAIAWPDAQADGPQANTFAKQIRQAFAARGLEVNISITAAQQKAASVVFNVGANTYGPFPKSRAAAGVEASISAYWLDPDTDESDLY